MSIIMFFIVFRFSVLYFIENSNYSINKQTFWINFVFSINFGIIIWPITVICYITYIMFAKLKLDKMIIFIAFIGNKTPKLKK